MLDTRVTLPFLEQWTEGWPGLDGYCTYDCSITRMWFDWARTGRSLRRSRLIRYAHTSTRGTGKGAAGTLQAASAVDLIRFFSPSD